MRVISITHARDHLGEVFNQTIDDYEPTIITRSGDGEGKRAVVVISVAQYQAMTKGIDSSMPAAEPQD